MLRIRRHLTDLNYYREDAHIAAWQPFYDVDGRVFETLTHFGGARQQPQRNWPNSFPNIAIMMRPITRQPSKNWSHAAGLPKMTDKYIITEAGKKTRQEAEDRTDEYFAKPFAILSEAEIEELKDLLEKLAEVVKPPEEEEESS